MKTTTIIILLFIVLIGINIYCIFQIQNNIDNANEIVNSLLFSPSMYNGYDGDYALVVNAIYNKAKIKNIDYEFFITVSLPMFALCVNAFGYKRR